MHMRSVLSRRSLVLSRRPVMLISGLPVAVACGAPGGAVAGDGTAGCGPTITIETRPAPLQSGRQASVTIRVKDSDGSPVTGGTVSFRARHTGMNMGEEQRPATEREPGVYTGAFLPSMTGGYRLTVAVDAPGGRSQQSFDVRVQ